MEHIEPLRASRNRQAVPALRGYAYQAWQSALAWITLTESETLFLEGAEDLDVVMGENAVTVQIKETARSKTLTLNSSDVAEAIAHFWEHRNKNPERRISFHLISTSKRSREQGDPFGGERGLDLWDRCKRAGVDLSALRAFLRSSPRLPADLREFIATAPDEKVRKEIISRIRWDTGSQPQEDVEELIRERLIAWGHRQQLLPDECLAVLPHLYLRIWEVIVREENRSLRISDFATLFQDVTTDRESKSELRRLRRRDRTLSQLQSEHNSLSPAIPQGLALGSLRSPASEMIGLPVFDRLAKREDLIAELRSRLTARGIIILKGSMGMAKSTLASQLIAGERSDWRHLDLRGFPSEVIRFRLLDAALLSSEGAAPHSCVIDDLNFDEKPDLYVNTLIGLIRSILSQGGSVIVTTQGDMPSKVRLTFELTEECVFSVPVLSQGEIREVAKNYGCPDGIKLAAWVGAILANTSGHPLLVHAQVINLAASNWPRPNAEDFLKSVVIEDVRREIRKKLQEQIPEEARTLAYRLSILTSYFRRSHALHLASFPPAIKNPGEAFDLLLGPWIERLDSGYHRLSDLLRGSGNQVFSALQIKQLNAAAASVFSTEQPVSPSDLQGIILHGLAGEHDDALFGAYKASGRVSVEHWPALSSEIFVFSYFRLEGEEMLYPPNHFLSLLLRHLQLRVAVESAPSKIAIQVAERWSQEIESLDDRRVPGSKLLMQFTLLSEILKLPSKVRFPTPFIVRSLMRGLALLQDARAQAPRKKILRQMLAKGGQWTQYREYVLRAALRCRSVSDLAEFLETLSVEATSIDPMSSEPAQLLWNEFKENNHLAMQLIDGAWLDESKAPTPDWPKCIETLEAASESGRAVGADSLVAASNRAKAIVLQEYIRDTEAALRALDQAERELGYKHLVLEDYRAKILSLERRDEEAVRMWMSLAPALDADNNPARAFSYQAAAICASRLGEWTRAALFYQSAESAVREAKWTDDIAASFKADRAFVEWLEGNHAEAIRLFVEVIDEIDRLRDRAGNQNTNQLRGKIGSALLWMARSLKDDGDTTDPPYGVFSDFDRRVEIDDSTAAKLAQTVYLWYALAELELSCDADDSAFARFEKAAFDMNIPHIQSSLSRLRLKRSLRNLDLEDLVYKYASFVIDLSEHAQTHEGPGLQISGSQLLLPLLFVALVRFVSERKKLMAPLSKWAEDAKRHGLLDDRLKVWLGCVSQLVTASESDLVAAMKDTQASMDCRSVAALLLSADESLDPENRLYADVGLLAPPDLFGLWQEDVERNIASLVSNGWSRAIVAYRFALRSPNLTGPAITNACGDEAKGLKKAARVILAARMAVSVRIDNTILSRLKALAD